MAARRSTRVKIDPETILGSVVDEVVSRLGLDILGLTREDYMNILRPLVESIVANYSSRPPKESVISKLVNNPRPVYMLASAYLLEKYDVLNEDQLEFIVSNAPEIAAKYVARLYQEAKRLGRDDVIPLLRSAWEQYGRPTPVECPYCGFRAVTPELVCMVCGREVKERDIKEAIGFEEMLREFVEIHGASAVREAIERGYVLLGDTLYPPSAREDNGLLIPIYLSRREKDLLRKLTSLVLAEHRGGM